MVKNITELTVYESSNGGNTVYVRSYLNQDKSLDCKYTKHAKNTIEHWVEIFLARSSNSALDELCHQIEMLYELTKNNK